MLVASLIARRLERQNKRCGTALLVNETTLAGACGAIDARPLDVIAVKERGGGRILEHGRICSERRVSPRSEEA